MVSFNNLLSSERGLPDWKTLAECTVPTLAYVEMIREGLVFLHYFRIFISLNLKLCSSLFKVIKLFHVAGDR